MFPAYAGGKFISNCLCLSRQFVPSFSNFDLNRITDIDYRLNTILKTIPNKDQMSNWLRYEFGEHDRDSDFYKLVKRRKLRCIRTSHGFDIKLIEQWKPGDIVKLINYEKFRLLAYGLKKTNRSLDDEDNQDRYNRLCGTLWPTYDEFAAVGFDSRKLKVDDAVRSNINQFYPLGSISIQTNLFDQSTIFDKQLFLKEMKNLYLVLGLDDFNEEATSIFYTRYATIHNI